MPNKQIQSLTVDGVTYDIVDNTSGYINAQYIENKTDYSIPVSRAGEIIAGETAIGTDSTNFPTSKAVVDYVDERVVQEIEAIDIPTVPTKTSDLTNDSGYLTASDIASVMTYKGTKANYAALPSTGNTTGDVWHLTDTGAEWAWDGSVWQELGTAIDLSNYATKATTLAGYGITDARIQNGTITLGSNTITPLTSFTETDPTVPSWAKQSSKPSYGLTEISGTDDLRAIEGLTGTSGLLKKTAANTWTLDTNTYLTSYTETDPTVPSWAKQSSKPTYTATEVGALPDSTVIPSKTSDLTNDSGFITSYTDEKVKTISYSADNSGHPIVFNTTSSVATTETKQASIDFTFSANSSNYYTLSVGVNASAKGRIWINTGDGDSGHGTYLVSSSKSGRTLTLPNATGTIALTSDIPDTSSFLTSETDPVFSASAAAGITSTNITNWNNRVSSINWNSVSHELRVTQYGTTSTAMAQSDMRYDSTNNTNGFLTLADLPIYDGTVV